MKKLLKILGFIGSIAVGIATVNHLIKSSKSNNPVVLGALKGETSSVVTHAPIKVVKISKTHNIEQDYQPKSSEEIPVEFVQIATSDIDEGRKLSNIESYNALDKSATTVDKVVKVEQGSMYPVSYSRSAEQQAMPTQDDMFQDVNPHFADNNYPSDYTYTMGYQPKHNTVSDNGINHVSEGLQNSYPVHHQNEQPERTNNRFRKLNEDIDSSNKNVDSSAMTPLETEKSLNTQQEENMQAPQVAQDPDQNSSSWQNSIKKGLSFLAGAAGLVSFIDQAYSLKQKYFPSAADQKKKEEPVKKETEEKQVEQTEEQEAPASSMDKNIAAGATAGVAFGGLAYNQYKKSSQSTSKQVETKLEQGIDKPKSKPGITNTNQTPNELPKVDAMPAVGSGSSNTGLLKQTRVARMSHENIPNEMIEVGGQVATSNKNIELLKPNGKAGITQAPEVLELPEIVNPIASHAQLENAGSLRLSSNSMQTQTSNGEICTSSSLQQLEQKRIEALSILGVDTNATLREIKAAFNNAALKFHPDKATLACKDKFIEIADAYEYLTKDYPQQLQKLQNSLEFSEQKLIGSDHNPIENRSVVHEQEYIENQLNRNDVMSSVSQEQNYVMPTNAIAEELKQLPAPSVAQVSNSYWQSAWNTLTSTPVLYGLSAAAAIASAPLLLPAAAVATPFIATPMAIAAPVAMTTAVPVAAATLAPSAMAALALKALLVAKTAAKFLPGPAGIIARLIP